MPEVSKEITQNVRTLTEYELRKIDTVHRVFEKGGYSVPATNWLQDASGDIEELLGLYSEEMSPKRGYLGMLNQAIYKMQKAAALEYQHGKKENVPDILDAVAMLYDITDQSEMARRARELEMDVKEHIKSEHDLLMKLCKDVLCRTE